MDIVGIRRQAGHEGSICDRILLGSGKRRHLAEQVKAPVEAGQVCGTVTVTYGEEILGTSDLIATVSVTRSEFLFMLERIKAFTASRFFKATIVFAVVFSIAYVLIQAHLREKKRRHGIFY